MKIFVTGGSGFLGQRLITRLVMEGHTVTGLARSSKAADSVRKAGAAPIVGDLSGISAWETALHGHDVVIHAASPVEFWGTWADFDRDIVQATIGLYDATAKQGAKRFIYISSESVLQDTKPLWDITEEEPYPDEPNSYYGKAKKLAEIALRNSHLLTELVILRPTFIWGKGVAALDTMLTKMKNGQFMWIDEGKTVIECVHVDNVVEAIVLSLTKGTHKHIYNITDDAPKTARELITALVGTQGITPPEKSMPSAIAGFAAWLVESVWKMMGIRTPPPLSRFELSFVAMPRRYRIDAAKRDLGYRPVISFEHGLLEMTKTK